MACMATRRELLAAIVRSSRRLATHVPQPPPHRREVRTGQPTRRPHPVHHRPPRMALGDPRPVSISDLIVDPCEVTPGGPLDQLPRLPVQAEVVVLVILGR